METRVISPDDAPLLAQLHAESFGDAHWGIEHFKENLALTTTQGLIVSIDDMPQGFILCQVVDDEAEILTFCVSTKSRRTGLGRFLLDSVLASLRHQNIWRIFLEVATDNDAALALYEKAGFHIIGKRIGYYRRGTDRVDAAMLELSLK